MGRSPKVLWVRRGVKPKDWGKAPRDRWFDSTDDPILKKVISIRPHRTGEP
jgi:hypothetical protein